MHPMLNIAIRAARAAGDIIIREMDRVSDLDVDSKGKNDFVTEIDKKAEQIIINTIQQSYPEHAFLCEESGQQGKVISSGLLIRLMAPPISYTSFHIMLFRLL